MNITFHGGPLDGAALTTPGNLWPDPHIVMLADTPNFYRVTFDPEFAEKGDRVYLHTFHPKPQPAERVAALTIAAATP